MTKDKAVIVGSVGMSAAMMMLLASGQIDRMVRAVHEPKPEPAPTPEPEVKEVKIPDPPSRQVVRAQAREALKDPYRHAHDRRLRANGQGKNKHELR